MKTDIETKYEYIKQYEIRAFIVILKNFARHFRPQYKNSRVFLKLNCLNLIYRYDNPKRLQKLPKTKAVRISCVFSDI